MRSETIFVPKFELFSKKYLTFLKKNLIISKQRFLFRNHQKNQKQIRTYKKKLSVDQREEEYMGNNSQNQKQEDYSVMSAKDLASRLHIGRDKAYALIKSKGFPSIKLGGRYIVTSKALNEWLDQYEYKSFTV